MIFVVKYFETLFSRKMGCCSSRELGTDLYSLDPTFVDIPLLNRPRRGSVASEASGSRYFSMEHYTNSATEVPRRPSYEAAMVEHSTLSVSAAPELETSRQRKFNECFSHIEANTFQSIPIMSVQSHLSIPNPGNSALMVTNAFDDYSRFMDQVITTVLDPLDNMKVTKERDLVVILSDE